MRQAGAVVEGDKGDLLARAQRADPTLDQPRPRRCRLAQQLGDAGAFPGKIIVHHQPNLPSTSQPRPRARADGLPEVGPVLDLMTLDK